MMPGAVGRCRRHSERKVVGSETAMQRFGAALLSNRGERRSPEVQLEEKYVNPK